MIAGILLGLALAWAVGFAAVRACGRQTHGGRAAGLLAVSAALGAGLGATSCLAFLWLVIAGELNRGLLVAEVVFGVFLALCAKRISAAGPAGSAGETGTGGSFSARERTVAVWLTVAWMAAAGAHAWFGIKSPHGGGYDPWVTWNLRARFLFRGGEDWQRGFSEVLNWSHPDYPLLLPVSVARLWTCAGGESMLAPALVASLLFAATVAALMAGLALTRGREQAMLGGIAALATTFFVTHGASQFADVPLAFFILATLVHLALHDHAPGLGKPHLMLAGLMAGCAAWTKNEGLLFVGAAISGRALVTVKRLGLRPAARQLAPFFAGLLPVLAVVVLFKAFIPPPNDLIAGQSPGATLARLLDPSRHLTVLRWFGERIVLFDNGGVVHIVPVLAACFLICGCRADAFRRSETQTCALVLGLMLGGFALVYVCTPHDLLWHLETSLDRLIVQLWPSAVFLFFSVVRTPGEIERGEGRDVFGRRH